METYLNAQYPIVCETCAKRNMRARWSESYLEKFHSGDLKSLANAHSTAMWDDPHFHILRDTRKDG